MLVTLAMMAGLLAASQVTAQAPTDFPTYKGNSARTGRAADINPGTGTTTLRWYLPQNSVLSQVLDNTAPAPQTAQNPDGSGWFSPAVDGAAAFAYYVRTPGNEIARPAYTMTRATAATADPRVPVNAANLRSFEWNFTIPLDTLKHWSAYVWLPIGPCQLGGGAIVYPQRYYVYQVLVNGAPQFYDVVDTYSAGSGWVRLGSGGAPGDVVVRAQAGDALTIRLLNTMPRDDAGNLTMPGLPGTYVVYADAAKIVATDGYVVAPPTVMTVTRPTVTGTEDVPQVVVARNLLSSGSRNGQPVTTVNAVVSAFRFNGSSTANTSNTVETHWSFSLPQNSTNTSAVDNNRATITGSGFAPSTATGRFTGTDYYQAILTSGSATGDVRYSPDLEEGTYEIYAYLAGDDSTNSFGNVVYEIREGAAVEAVEVNQSVAGWVRVGDRRYSNAEVAKLDVRVTNRTNVGGDAGKLAFADAIAFVGESDLSVTSTPVQAVVGIRKWVAGADGRPQMDANGNITTQVVQTPVVIVADERGVIHCLDAVGNPDGTTTTYWTYPSRQDLAYDGWVDPNVRQNIDGRYRNNRPAAEQVVTAIMPTGFNMSSAAVHRINGKDFLYIGATNGRVYCIDMEGRGDYMISQATYGAGNLGPNGLPLRPITNSEPGSARRQWTYPTDPLDDPNSRQISIMGPFIGSVTVADSSNGPTVFVPDSNGRIHALNALGDASSRSTTNYTGWPFPALTQETLGAVASTPSYEFGKLYFGTLKKDENPGEFYALNDNGTVAWMVNQVGTDSMSDFRCSPISAPGALIGDAANDYVYTLNDNGYMYALNAANGSVLWSDYSLPLNSRTSLGLAKIGNNIPVVTVTSMTGVFAAFYAAANLPVGVNYRVVLQRRATNKEELTAVAYAGGRATPAAALQTWLYFGDRGGNIYAFSDDAAGGSYVDPDDEAPVDEVVNMDDASSFYFSKTKFHLITQQMYRRLQGLSASRPDYDTGTTTERSDKSTFDWGETVYMLVYDFPFNQSVTGPVSPPVINLEISVDGKVIRSLPAASLQWRNAGAGNPPVFGSAVPSSTVPPDPNLLLDGYALVQFTFQGGGQNALPPGKGRFQISITLGGSTNGNPGIEVALPPEDGVFFPPNTDYRVRDFTVLNPIGLSVDVANPSNPGPGYSIGFDPLGLKPETATNGSPDIGGVPLSKLASTTGLVPHGQTGATTVYVYDRSLMTLLRGPNAGIDNIRVKLDDLKWENRDAAVLQPLNSSLYPNFEDLPVNVPNISVDYPDIARERVRVLKDPNGRAENPVTFKSSLKPPTVGTNTRTLNPTRFDFSVDVPRYQPPNLTNIGGGPTGVANSVGAQLPQGYLGRISVFVDSIENGNLDTLAAREVYRSFNLMSGVIPSRQLLITTPDVNLGSLATGTGYSPYAPDASSPFNPWLNSSSSWSGAYQEFGARNEGNVNLLNVRLAKAAGTLGWPFLPATNDPLAWLNGATDLWTDVNPPFVAPNLASVFLPKPRVEDRTGTELMANPTSRLTGQQASPGLPSGRPKLAVSVPFGFPSGTYSSLLRVIEDDNNDLSWTMAPTEEPASDPSLRVTFNIRETRVTTGTTRYTAPFVEDLSSLVPAGNEQVFPFSNLQPAALRGPQGTLLMAWTSNRPTREVTELSVDPSQRDAWRIYLGSVVNQFRQQGSSTSPLWDLGRFEPDPNTGKWFRPVGPARGYPSILNQARMNAVFQPATGESYTFGSARFYSPVLPAAGAMNPYDPSPSLNRLSPNTYMAFVGDAKKTVGTTSSTDSKIFITPIRMFAAGGVSMADTPVVLRGDPNTTKGKPSVALSPSGGAIVFYPGTASGTSRLYWAPFNGTAWGQPATLNVGRGFESVGAPSAMARYYIGANTAEYGNQIIDLFFEGKLRGRPNNEIYMGRLPLNSSGLPGNFAFLPMQSNERLTSAGDGAYRGRGLVWDMTNARTSLVLIRQNQAPLVLFDHDPVGGTLLPQGATFDSETGLVTADSRLGGKLTLDPSQGIVRFSSGGIPQGSELRLSYRPAFFRMSAEMGGSGFTAPTALFDDRYITPDVYNPPANRPIPNWYRPDGSPVRSGNSRTGNFRLTNDRYVLFYNRAAVSAGSTARPLMNTVRLGVRLPVAMTDASGLLLPVRVVGSGAYEIDPAQNRIYFTAADEDRQVQVYVSNTLVFDGRVGFVQETGQQEVPIEQAVNEQNLTAFMDPFVYQNVNNLRPPLMWLFWSSTRAGNPDVYFQTIAPHIAPVTGGP